VPDHDFLFTLRVPENGRLDAMLSDLTTSVLRHVGYAAGDIAELGGQIRAGLAESRSAGAEYDVQFRAHAGELEIIVSQGDRHVFRAARRLP
jgi:hypothetical protein